MCEFIDSLSSIKTPRFLTTDDLITAELPTVIEEILTLDKKFCLIIIEEEFVMFHP